MTAKGQGFIILNSLLVVGGCRSAKPSARTATTAREKVSYLLYGQNFRASANFRIAKNTATTQLIIAISLVDE